MRQCSSGGCAMARCGGDGGRRGHRRRGQLEQHDHGWSRGLKYRHGAFGTATTVLTILVMGLLLLSSGGPCVAVPLLRSGQPARTSAAAATFSCPSSAIPASLRKPGSPETYCLCARGDATYCTGPMCRLGRLGDSSGDFALGFSSKCTACTCRSATGAQRTVVPITTWDDTQVYYHLHISKTGGTTLEHIVQQLVRHPASPAAMTVCKTEKHPFSHPPLFADPKELERSGCNVITAEGRMRFIEQQLPYVQPHMLILLRHPVLRTLSQFRHDLIQESTLANKEWRTPYTGGFSSLKELYKNTKGVVHKRYRDWQSDLLYHPNITFPDALENMTFIGITDFYKTTMCLFYFTFQIPSLLDGCQERPLTVYNKACQGDDCERFQNTKERHVRDEDNHKRLNDALSHVDTETRELIEEHTRLDQALYDAALDLFWRRVAVMEQVVGEQFHDLPDEYRLRITRLPSDPVFEPL